MASSPAIRLGVDIGGTFTDVALEVGDRRYTAKGLTTARAPEAGVLAIVRAIIALAEAFNLELMAEGVEQPTAAMTLLQHGCHRAQGFLLSRPVPGEAMAELLAKKVISVDFSAATRS